MTTFKSDKERAMNSERSRQRSRTAAWALALAMVVCVLPAAAQGPFPNLEATSFGAPTCAEIGEVVGGDISITVTNTGSADLQAGPATCAGNPQETTCSSIGFYVSADSTITTSDVLLTGGRENIRSIDPDDFQVGESIVDFLFSGASIAAGSPTGSVFIGVVVDESDTVTEESEADNTAAQAITIVAAGSGGCGQPDLVIDSITHSPATPDTETEIQFTAVVKNIGGAAAGASTLSFKIGGESPSDPDALFAVPTLAPGEDHTVMRTEVLTVAQNYLNTAVADFNDDVAESDENNNTATDSYTVVDVSEPGSPFVYKIMSLPANGKLFDSSGAEIVAVPFNLLDQKVTYEPNTGYAGVDQFLYQIDNGGLLSDIADVFVTVGNGSCVTCVNLTVDFIGAGDGDVTPNPHPQGAPAEFMSCAADCNLPYQPGATVKLQARPADDSDTFVGWGGACASAGSNQIATVVMPSSGSLTCTANFSEN